METAAEKWARHKGAKVRLDLAKQHWLDAGSRLAEEARIVRVTLEDARQAQRLEDEGAMMHDRAVSGLRARRAG